MSGVGTWWLDAVFLRMRCVVGDVVFGGFKYTHVI